MGGEAATRDQSNVQLDQCVVMRWIGERKCPRLPVLKQHVEILASGKVDAFSICHAQAQPNYRVAQTLKLFDPPLVTRQRRCIRRVDAVDSDFNLDIFQRSEEHTSELQSLMRISYAVFCLKKKNM